MSSIQDINNQIAQIERTTNECEGSLSEFNTALISYQEEMRDMSINREEWTQFYNKCRDWDDMEEDYINEDRQRHNWIWRGNTHHNCANYPQRKIEVWPFKYDETCLTAGNRTREECAKCYGGSCIGPRYSCTKSISADAYKSTTYYADWLTKNPKPTEILSSGKKKLDLIKLTRPINKFDIIGATTLYVSTNTENPYKPYPFPDTEINMVCQSCTQTMNIGNVTGTHSDVQIAQNAYNQDMNCVAELQVEKTNLLNTKAELERQAGIDSRNTLIEAQRAAAAAEEYRLGMINHQRLEQARLAAINTQKNDDAAKNKKIMLYSGIGIMLFIVFIIFIVVVIMLLGDSDEDSDEDSNEDSNEDSLSKKIEGTPEYTEPT